MMPSSAALPPFKSNHKRAQWAAVFLMAAAVLSIISIVSLAMQIGLLTRAQIGDVVTLSEAKASDSRFVTLVVLDLIVTVFTGLAYLAWLHRSYKNLEALDARYLDYSPLKAVLSFLIPLVNLVRPYYVVNEIWVKSEPDQSKLESWAARPSFAVIKWWWLLYVAGGFIGRGARQWLLQLIQSRPVAADLIGPTWGVLIAEVISVAAAILAIIVIRSIESRQEERMRRMKPLDYFPDKPVWSLRLFRWSAGIGIVLIAIVLVRSNAAAVEALQMPAADDQSTAGATSRDKANNYLQQGLVYRLNGDFESAVVAFSKGLEIDPKSAILFYSRGSSYSEMEDYETAIDDFNHALALHPAMAEALTGRGIAYHFQGDAERALTDYIAAIRANPKYAVAYMMRGVVYADRGEYEAALDDYAQAIKLNPKLNDAYYGQGKIYRKQGDYDKAVAAYTQAIKINSTDPFAYNDRGLAYYLKGETTLAIKDFDKAIEIDPTMGAAYISRGIMYEEQKDYKQAIADFDKAIKLEPGDADIYYHRGLSHNELGHREQAIADLEKALKVGLRPDDEEEAKAILAKLEK